jgi:hypothetical protein
MQRMGDHVRSNRGTAAGMNLANDGLTGQPLIRNV